MCCCAELRSKPRNYVLDDRIRGVSKRTGKRLGVSVTTAQINECSEKERLKNEIIKGELVLESRSALASRPPQFLVAGLMRAPQQVNYMHGT